MKKSDIKLARVIAHVAKKAADNASGSASGWLTYQPKEPPKPR